MLIHICDIVLQREVAAFSFVKPLNLSTTAPDKNLPDRSVRLHLSSQTFNVKNLLGSVSSSWFYLTNKEKRFKDNVWRKTASEQQQDDDDGLCKMNNPNFYVTNWV